MQGSMGHSQGSMEHMGVCGARGRLWVTQGSMGRMVVSVGHREAYGMDGGLWGAMRFLWGTGWFVGHMGFMRHTGIYGVQEGLWGVWGSLWGTYRICGAHTSMGCSLSLLMFPPDFLHLTQLIHRPQVRGALLWGRGWVGSVPVPPQVTMVTMSPWGRGGHSGVRSNHGTPWMTLVANP